MKFTGLAKPGPVKTLPLPELHVPKRLVALWAVSYDCAVVKELDKRPTKRAAKNRVVDEGMACRRLDC